MRHRVFTYITRGQELLLLRYPDGRYVLPQIPGGTVKPNETPSDAALREAKEETGLEAIHLVRGLGNFERDLSDIGRAEVIRAWFFICKPTSKRQTLGVISKRGHPMAAMRSSLSFFGCRLMLYLS